MLARRPAASYPPRMGFMTTTRRLLGLSGADGGTVTSALRNVGQLELYGAVVQPAPFDAPPAQETPLSQDDLPWELREPPAH